MPASSALLTDIGTVISNGPAAATLAASIAAAGPILDYPGNCHVARKMLQDAEVTLALVKASTDSSDTSLTQINAVLAALNGTGSPSTACITDMGTAIAAGPTAATIAKAIAAAGPINGYVGNCKGVLLKLQEAKKLLTLLNSVTDGGDTSKSTIANLLLALA